jgi:hypothetical protein
MAEKRYAVTVSIFLGISVVLTLFIFLLVSHHRHVPDRVRLDRGALLGDGSSVPERVKSVTQVNVPSAETQQESVQPKTGTQR